MSKKNDNHANTSDASSPGSMTTAERQACSQNHLQTWPLTAWQGGSCLVHTGLAPRPDHHGPEEPTPGCPGAESWPGPSVLWPCTCWEPSKPAAHRLSSCPPGHCRLLHLPSLWFQCAVPDPHILPWLEPCSATPALQRQAAGPTQDTWAKEGQAAAWPMRIWSVQPSLSVCTATKQGAPAESSSPQGAGSAHFPAQVAMLGELNSCNARGFRFKGGAGEVLGE